MEVAAVAVVDNKVTKDQFYWLSDIDHYAFYRKWPIAPSRAVPFSSVFNCFKQLLGGAQVLVSHPKWATSFLNQELARYQLPEIDAICAGMHDLDALLREVDPKYETKAIGISNYLHECRHLKGARLNAQTNAELYVTMEWRVGTH